MKALKKVVKRAQHINSTAIRWRHNGNKWSQSQQMLKGCIFIWIHYGSRVTVIHCEVTVTRATGHHFGPTESARAALFVHLRHEKSITWFKMFKNRQTRNAERQSVFFLCLGQGHDFRLGPQVPHNESSNFENIKSI